MRWVGNWFEFFRVPLWYFLTTFFIFLNDFQSVQILNTDWLSIILATSLSIQRVNGKYLLGRKNCIRTNLHLEISREVSDEWIKNVKNAISGRKNFYIVVEDGCWRQVRDVGDGLDHFVIKILYSVSKILKLSPKILGFYDFFVLAGVPGIFNYEWIIILQN